MGGRSRHKRACNGFWPSQFIDLEKAATSKSYADDLKVVSRRRRQISSCNAHARSAGCGALQRPDGRVRRRRCTVARQRARNGRCSSSNGRQWRRKISGSPARDLLGGARMAVSLPFWSVSRSGRRGVNELARRWTPILDVFPRERRRPLLRFIRAKTC